jgi:hypothetical protein
VQQLLEDAKIRLASVAGNVVGVSGQAILNALIEDQSGPRVMADLAPGRLRQKREQLAKANT